MLTGLNYDALREALARIEGDQANEDAAGAHSLAANLSLQGSGLGVTAVGLEALENAMAVAVNATNFTITRSCMSSMMRSSSRYPRHRPCMDGRCRTNRPGAPRSTRLLWHSLPPAVKYECSWDFSSTHVSSVF